MNASPAEGHLERRFGLGGQVALVTGARQGIGAAIARELAAAGAHVAVTSRRRADLDEIADEVRAAGVEALPLSLDVRAPADPGTAVDAVLERFGRLDVLVSNAATTSRTPAAEIDEGEWLEVLETNLSGAFRMAQAAARPMTAAGQGAIINVTSTYARRATPGRAAYSASKAGLEQLTRCLAVEWAPKGIRVNAVAPGTVATPSRAELLADEAFAKRRLEAIPLGRFGVPEEVAGAVAFLAGPAAGHVTGHVLLVDGGFTIA